MIAPTPPEHEHSARVDQAVEWLRSTPPQSRPRPLLPSLRSMFGLTASEAISAIREANEARHVQ